MHDRQFPDLPARSHANIIREIFYMHPLFGAYKIFRIINVCVRAGTRLVGIGLTPDLSFFVEVGLRPTRSSVNSAELRPLTKQVRT